MDFEERLSLNQKSFALMMNYQPDLGRMNLSFTKSIYPTILTNLLKLNSSVSFSISYINLQKYSIILPRLHLLTFKLTNKLIISLIFYFALTNLSSNKFIKK